jgi:hypothetical protein
VCRCLLARGCGGWRFPSGVPEVANAVDQDMHSTPTCCQPRGPGMDCAYICRALHRAVQSRVRVAVCGGL